MIMIMSELVFQAFAALSEGEARLSVGQRLFRRDDPVRHAYLLRSGRIDLVRYHGNGKELTLHRAGERTVLAEASLYAERYHCDALCVDDAALLVVPRAKIVDRLAADEELARSWAAYLAHALQGARHRSELLTRKTVAERLDDWLDWNGGNMPPKGRWKALAAELGVTPEALYRTLAQRTRDGV